MRLGIDIGTTTASAVLVNESKQVTASFSAPHTQSTAAALNHLLDQVATEIDLDAITYTAIVTNIGKEAIARGDLSRVGVLRISAPASTSIRPAGTWPASLASIVSGESVVVAGGHDYTGQEFSELDRAAVRNFATRCRDTVGAIAITGLSSTVNPHHEQEAARIIRSVLGYGIPLTLAHEIGGIGLLERENSAILNAALVRAFARTFQSWRNVLARRGLTDDIFFAQNDGTLASSTEAIRHPVLTIENTTSHAMRGAAHLSGKANSIVVHAQPHAITFGALVDGYPTESTLPMEIEGVRTHHRMPDLITVHPQGLLSPDRDALTVTERHESVSALRRIAGSRHDLALLAVGDCAPVFHTVALSDAHRVEQVKHGTAAAAVGAAVADVSGRVDRTCDYDHRSRDSALAETIEAARLAAVRAGADVRKVRVDSIHETPLGYTPGPGARLRVRAVGPVLEATSI
ncbi:hypothetical protein IU460_28310 [Nocardia farcinica]|nr:hypothetical protein [Nocardia farcinica]